MGNMSCCKDDDLFEEKYNKLKEDYDRLHSHHKKIKSLFKC